MLTSYGGFLIQKSVLIFRYHLSVSFYPDWLKFKVSPIIYIFINAIHFEKSGIYPITIKSFQKRRFWILRLLKTMVNSDEEI